MSGRRYTGLESDEIVKFLNKKISYLPCVLQFALALFISYGSISAIRIVGMFVGTDFALQGIAFIGIACIACFILSIYMWKSFIKCLKGVIRDRELIMNGEIYVTDVVVVDKYTRAERRYYDTDNGGRRYKMVTSYFIVVKDIDSDYSTSYEVTHKEYNNTRGNDSAKVVEVSNQSYLML